MAMGHDGLPSGPEAGGRHSLPMLKVEGAEGFLILPIARRPLFVGRRAFCGMHWPRALAPWPIRPSSVHTEYIPRTYRVHIAIVGDPSGTRNLASIRAAVAAGPDHPPTGQGPYQRRPRLRAVTLAARPIALTRLRTAATTKLRGCCKPSAPAIGLSMLLCFFLAPLLPPRGLTQARRSAQHNPPSPPSRQQ